MLLVRDTTPLVTPRESQLMKGVSGPSSSSRKQLTHAKRVLRAMRNPYCCQTNGAADPVCRGLLQLTCVEYAPELTGTISWTTVSTTVEPVRSALLTSAMV